MYGGVIIHFGDISMIIMTAIACSNLTLVESHDAQLLQMLKIIQMRKTKHDVFYAAALSATLSRSLSPGSVIVITLWIYQHFNIQSNCQLWKHIPDTEELSRSSAKSDIGSGEVMDGRL